jgi:autoinducer-2 kinase
VNDELLLAIDAGTGSCRAVLFNADGDQIAAAAREYTHLQQPGVPGSHVFDTTANWKLIAQCVREALAVAGTQPTAVKGVSATSMREGMVLYDASGEEIWACPNIDGRAGAEAAELVESGLAQEIYERSGDWVSITAPARFLWLARNEPGIFASIAHVGMLGDWILKRLTGDFATDPSLASSSGMFQLGERCWSERILDICRLNPRICPPVLDPGTVVGGVTATASADTGLSVGTPVVVGGADTQLALVGLGAPEPGRCTIVGGSFWQHTMVLDEPLIDPLGRLRTLCHTAPGRWMIEGIGFYSGMVMRWFRDSFCELEIAQAQRDGVSVYELLENKAAAQPPGANGVFGIFSNLMQANRWVHASPAFVGFDVGSQTRTGKSDCFRAIEESAAYVSRGHLDIVAEVTATTIDEVMLCGGAANGTLWPQIIADTLAMPVRIPVIKESTALGAALYAGVGAGLLDDAGSAARRISRCERIFEPDAEAVAAYRSLYEQWGELYQHSMRIADVGVVRPLWRAAGT